MNIYIIKKATGEIVAVNRTIVGVALEAYGLDIATVGGIEANRESIEDALASSPSCECLTSDGEILVIERHFLGN